MPSKGKGLNCFSALSLSAPHSATDGISTGSSSHDEGSNSTVGGHSVAPCTSNDVEMSTPQHVPVYLSPPIAPSTPCAVSTNTQAAFNLHSDQSAGVPATPSSFTPPTLLHLTVQILARSNRHLASQLVSSALKSGRQMAMALQLFKFLGQI